jgi:hypothetical protein
MGTLGGQHGGQHGGSMGSPGGTVERDYLAKIVFNNGHAFTHAVTHAA